MPSEQLHYDVAVVGARAAGAATAMLLARAGLRVLVVDRSRYGSDTLSTHALMRGGVMQLQRWGLLDRIVDAGTPPIRRTTFRYANDSVELAVKPAHGVDALYAPRRTLLDPVLVDAASAAGAHLRFGVTVTDVARDRQGRVTGVRGRDAAGAPFAADAALTVGADGMRSTIARKVGAPVERAGTGASAVTYGYWSDVDVDGYEWIFRRDACAGVIPTNGGLVCVFAASRPDRIRPGGRHRLDAVLERAAPDISRRLRSGRGPAGIRGFAGHAGFLRRAFGPGWALVGDAGYWKDPLSAHGLTDALRDAELLARAVLSSSSGEVSEHEALAGYQATRDRLSQLLFDTVDTIAALRWTDAEIGALLRQLSASMVGEVDALADLDAAPVP
jgi:flavin-dependent dehydrogenase